MSYRAVVESLWPWASLSASDRGDIKFPSVDVTSSSWVENISRRDSFSSLTRRRFRSHVKYGVLTKFGRIGLIWPCSLICLLKRSVNIKPYRPHSQSILQIYLRFTCNTCHERRCYRQQKLLTINEFISLSPNEIIVPASLLCFTLLSDDLQPFSFPLIEKLRTCLSLLKISTPLDFILSMKNWLSGWSPCTTEICRNLWRKRENFFNLSSLLRQCQWVIMRTWVRTMKNMRFDFRMSVHLESRTKLRVRPTRENLNFCSLLYFKI